MEWLFNFRYDYPKTFRTIVLMFLGCLVFVGFMLLPHSVFGSAIGVTTLQKKVSAFSNAVFWKSRALIHTADPTIRLNSTFGNMTGLDKTGMLITSIPTGSRYVQRTVQVADTKITDLYGAAGLIGQYRLEDARFDMYHDNQAVVWIRGAPFNIKLIEAGFAIPDPNPPTNIVDEAFATYYWRIFKGEGND